MTFVSAYSALEKSARNSRETLDRLGADGRDWGRVRLAHNARLLLLSGFVLAVWLARLGRVLLVPVHVATRLLLVALPFPPFTFPHAATSRTCSALRALDPDADLFASTVGFVVGLLLRGLLFVVVFWSAGLIGNRLEVLASVFIALSLERSLARRANQICAARRDERAALSHGPSVGGAR